MPKPCAPRRAMAWPMRPMPRMPSVVPWMSAPANRSSDHCFHWPARRKCSLSVMRRAVAISSAKPKSAVVSVSTSGALVACTPAAVIASRSKLLWPTARLATIFSCGQAASSAASMYSLPVVSTPSLPCRRSMSSTGDQTTPGGVVSTSKCSRRRSTTSGNTARAIRMAGRWLMRVLRRPAGRLRTAAWRSAGSRRRRRARRSPARPGSPGGACRRRPCPARPRPSP